MGIFKDFGQHFINRHIAANDFLGTCRAERDIGLTHAALYAVFLMEHNLCIGNIGLRIMAPQTTQRTALEKYRGADTGAVIYGKMLDVKNGACHIVVLTYYTYFSQ